MRSLVYKNMGGLQFAQDADGNWGYKAGGADTVHPFKSDPVLIETHIQTNTTLSTSLDINRVGEYKYLILIITLSKAPETSFSNLQKECFVANDDAELLGEIGAYGTNSTRHFVRLYKIPIVGDSITITGKWWSYGYFGVS